MNYPIYIIGIGSPYGDDQIGKDVIEQLQKNETLLPFIPQKLELLYLDRPGIRLLDKMKNSDNVFLIDAVKSGAKIGTLHCREKESIINTYTNISTHAIGVGETIALGHALGMLPKQVVLYGLEIGEIDVFGRGLRNKEILNAAKEKLVKTLIKEISLNSD